MYVYVTKFEGKPNLFKIGKSVSPASRNNSLSGSHGKIISSEHYKIGKDYSSVENFLHRKYSDYRKFVDGDGGTEFFCESVYEDVLNHLNRYRTEDYLQFDEDFISEQLKIERKRYYNLISKLLGYKESNLHNGEWHSCYLGLTDIVKIEACLEFGFPAKEVYQQYLNSDKIFISNNRFTTAGRIELAYKLATQGTPKEKNLEERLRAARDINKVLLDKV